MFQGTGTHVGKSLLVTGLCRLLSNRGFRVAPFKAQNMSNHAAVCPLADGSGQTGEIARSQMLQAQAARFPPSPRLNPVLLKPEGPDGSQLILEGRPAGRFCFADYRHQRERLLEVVLDHFRRLQAEADLVLVEGAGSLAEVNLRAADIANMGFAEAASLPVLVIGDIDRGGVLAQLVGSAHLLSPADRQRVQGFVVNKFRGNPAYFAAARPVLVQKTGWRDYGLVPWFEDHIYLPEEDSMWRGPPPPRLGAGETAVRRLRIEILRYPYASNLDEFQALFLDPSLETSFRQPGQPIADQADLVILPGSKDTLRDLETLCQTGWDLDLRYLTRRKKCRVLGICGGYQMLGRHLLEASSGSAGTQAGLEQPRTEGRPHSRRECQGLGFLPLCTRMAREKTTRPSRVFWGDVPIDGYEIHHGVSEVAQDAGLAPFLKDAEGTVQGVSRDGVEGGYIHGLFENGRFRRAYLRQIRELELQDYHVSEKIDQTLDKLAAHLARHLAPSFLETLERGARKPGRDGPRV